MRYFRPALVLLLWLGVMGVFLKNEVLPSLSRGTGDIPIPRAGWEETAGEEWLGIFFRGNQAGYIHYSFYPRQGEGGPGSALEITAWLKLASGGRENRVKIRGSFLVGTRGEVTRLELSVSSTEPAISLRALGEGGLLEARITAGGVTREMKFPLTISALPLHLFTPLLSARALRPGEVFTVPVPELLAGLAAGRADGGPARFEVDGDGRIRVDFGGVSGELKLDPDGRISEAAFPSGWSLSRQSEGEALAFLRQNPAGGPEVVPQTDSPGRAEF